MTSLLLAELLVLATADPEGDVCLLQSSSFLGRSGQDWFWPGFAKSEPGQEEMPGPPPKMEAKPGPIPEMEEKTGPIPKMDENPGPIPKMEEPGPIPKMYPYPGP